MEMVKTRKLYDIDAYATEFDAKVLSCEECMMKLADGGEQITYAVVLDQTLFFPEEKKTCLRDCSIKAQVNVITSEACFFYLFSGW